MSLPVPRQRSVVEAKLWEALHRYAKHDLGCEIWLNGYDEGYTLPCSCGLAKVFEREPTHVA